MNDFRTLPTVAAGGFTLATLGPQLAVALPVLAPVLLGAVALGLLIRARREDDEQAEAKAAPANASEGMAKPAAGWTFFGGSPAPVAGKAARPISAPVAAPAPAVKLASATPAPAPRPAARVAPVALAKPAATAAPPPAVHAHSAAKLPLGNVPASAPARPVPASVAAVVASPVPASGSRPAVSGVAASSPAPAIAAAPARPAVTDLVASAASSVIAPDSTPKLTAERLADVFKAGPLAKAAAVAALVKSGVGKSAAYAALKAGSRFTARLEALPDGRLAWKA